MPDVGPEVEQRLTEAIARLLAARAPTSSICPSEAARAVDPDGWRDLMEPARRVAGLLADAGEVEVTQGGRVVDVARARGPVRIRRTRVRLRRDGAEDPSDR